VHARCGIAAAARAWNDGAASQSYAAPKDLPHRRRARVGEVDRVRCRERVRAALYLRKQVVLPVLQPYRWTRALALWAA
jgi:hypothetical protein